MEIEVKENTVIVTLTKEEVKKLNSDYFKAKMLRRITSEAIKAGWSKEQISAYDRAYVIP